MKNQLSRLTIILLLIVSFQTAKAQEDVNQLDTLKTFVEAMNTRLDVLQRLKITGYIQTQWQKADTVGGAAAFSGGNFLPTTDQRFAVRRGRIKFAYNGDYTMYVLQFDVTEKGFATKDAYFNARDPWIGAVGVTGGIFDRPFGYEISYSSSSRETPERSRIFQTLFPGERDLGAKVTFQMPKTSPWYVLKLDMGLFAGNGVNLETDAKRDFIGHLAFNKAFLNETLKLGLGASYYNGSVYQGTANRYEVTGDGATLAFTKTTSADDKLASYGKRIYSGIDAQLSYQSPLGITTLRGEYISGDQPGVAGSSNSPTALPAADMYLRKMAGGYFYFLHNIVGTKFTVMAKYDWYDPNTQLKGDEIGQAITGTSMKSTAADLKYTTLGLGFVYAYTANVKLVIYKEFVKNETTKNITGSKGTFVGTTDYSKNIKDNVLTIRVQYKF